MTFYNRDSEGDYTRAPDTQQARVDKIEPGVYEIRIPMMGPPFLHPVATRKPVPPKLYGDATSFSDRIIKTYMDRRDKGLNTGILLEGIKGSGKSLTGALSINKVIDAGGFCITVNKPLTGDILKNIIGTPTQPVVLDFDEFEKIYKSENSSLLQAAANAGIGSSDLSSILRRAGGSSSNEAQESLLTFLSGGTVSGVLSIITVNDSSGINEYMRKRPSRIFYNKKYAGLPNDVIEAFSHDALDDKTLVPEFVRKTSRIRHVSFDILTSIADDVNRMKMGISDSMVLMGFGDEAKDSCRKLVMFKGVNVTSFYDGTSDISYGEGSGDSYGHDMYSSTKEEMKEYFDAKADPDFPKKELEALRAEFVPFSMLISDEVLQALPKKFRSSSSVANDGVRIHDSGVYVLPTNAAKEYQDDLLVLAVDSSLTQFAVYDILRALNIGTKEPDKDSVGKVQLTLGKQAAHAVAYMEEHGKDIELRALHGLPMPAPANTVAPPVPQDA